MATLFVRARVIAVAFVALVAVSCGDNYITGGGSGLVVTPSMGLHTNEAETTATFTVALARRPLTDVTIALVSSNTAEGTVSPATITIARDAWDQPVTVTATGVDDGRVDGAQLYRINLDAGTAGTAEVVLTNDDDDVRGVTVTPLTGLMTTESGGTATFTLALLSQPTANVAIAIASSDPTEGTVVPAVLTFTVDNWNAPQTVTVTGVDDTLSDGPVVYTINVGPATSTDMGYDGFEPDDVMVTNVDNDTAGVIVSPTTGLVTSEAGGTATFSVVLAAQPTATVAIVVGSDAPDEGLPSPTTLTFTTTNWSAPQNVVVTGVDDTLSDGDQTYHITLAPATSADPAYVGIDPADVTVINTDNDSPGATVLPSSGLQTTEAGGTAQFTIVLNTQPTADVTFALSTSDATEGTISPPSVTFTPANWNAPQTITATGVDDAIADGGQPYQAVIGPAVSTDAGYAGRDPADVSLTNLDNDSPGILVSPVAGLQTTESGGMATFTVVLLSQPLMPVTVDVASADLGEGTAAPASLVFTSLNWNVPRTVTVTGVDDAVADGNQLYTITLGAASSLDLGYNGVDPSDVTVTNLDNDSAGILVTPTTGLVTTEAGGIAEVSVVLLAQPTGIVTIPVSSSDTGEATVSTALLTFTTVNWNAPQVITVTGVDDAIADGNQPFTVVLGAASSADAGYAGLDPIDVSGTNRDNDSGGIFVSPTSGLVTTEVGGQDSFAVSLLSQPTGNVTIPVSSSDPGEGTVSPASLTFTPANWFMPQTVTLTGVDDLLADGDQPYEIVLAPATSTDPSYAGLDPANVSATNTDNESAGITVTPTSGLIVTEFGDTDTFDIVLNAPPVASVTIALSSSDTTEGTVSPTSVTFTTLNWNTAQTVTVTGLADLLIDGNQVFTIVTAPATSLDARYNGLDAANVQVTNIDASTPGVYVKARKLIRVSENGQSSFFRMRLTTMPTANVTCTLMSNDLTEGTISTMSVTFTPGNFATLQQINVVGVDDAIVDGAQLFSIVINSCTSTDLDYNGINPRDVSVLNRDND